jgi:hypothetical protein
MFDLPSLEGVEEVVISKEVLEGRPSVVHYQTQTAFISCS